MTPRPDEVENTHPEKSPSGKSGSKPDSSIKKVKDEAAAHSKGWRDSNLNAPN
jgi:hypothetical protein